MQYYYYVASVLIVELLERYGTHNLLLPVTITTMKKGILHFAEESPSNSQNGIQGSAIQ